MSIDPGVFIILHAALLCLGNLIVCNAGAWRIQLISERYAAGIVMGKFIVGLSVAFVMLVYVRFQISILLAFFMVFVAPMIGTSFGKLAAQGVHLQQRLPIPKQRSIEEISDKDIPYTDTLDEDTSTTNLTIQDEPAHRPISALATKLKNTPSDNAATRCSQMEFKSALSRRKGKEMKKCVTFADTVVYIG
ncbi:hypothetical protein F5Y11DRAFT_366341 [Daldinia sp. FL1419]|nr:hypothetical protein F5Y11DRAFT_366341 [Daldinia sp. FL1419]